jgi:glutamate dehydrogenase
VGRRAAHFRERGINVQEDSITVVGVGDMAGDVFGNGLLMSDKLQLVAAFNHLHIFIDPNPNRPPASSSVSACSTCRVRPGATTTPASCPKAAGSSRAARRASPSRPDERTLRHPGRQADPDRAAERLLKAPVDLLWNGGIGTYVKASSESHATWATRPTTLRVNGNELRCKWWARAATWA